MRLDAPPGDSGGVDGAAVIIKQWLAGPEQSAAQAGFGTLGPGLDEFLESVEIQGSRVVIDFAEGILGVDSLSHTTALAGIALELEANLGQLDGLEEVEFRVSGDCDLFWSNTPYGACTIMPLDGRLP